MWLGRVDAHLDEKKGAGAPELDRRQLDFACALRSLMGPDEMSAWKQLEATMNTFVGERDAMGPGDVDRFYRDLGIANMTALAGVSDRKILETLDRGKYGHQRISSDLTMGSDDAPVSPPNTFSFTGQRYIVDSHVFSELAYDRVTPKGNPPRLLPNPLDIAFAVLKNDQARTLLADEIERYGYGPNLDAARARTEANDERYWETSLYNLWLGALRALSSPSAQAPAVTRRA